MSSSPPSSPLFAKVSDEFKLALTQSEAVALSRQAAEGAQWMHVVESEEGRLLVKYIPVPMGKNAKIEVLFSQSGDAATTVALTGWFFGMGKGQVRTAVKKLRTAIEEQAQQQGASA